MSSGAKGEGWEAMGRDEDALRVGTEDAVLMARVRVGDEAAFAELMARWEVPVKRLIARIVFNVGEAEELAQETMVRVWQQREKFREGAAVRAVDFCDRDESRAQPTALVAAEAERLAGGMERDE